MSALKVYGLSAEARDKLTELARHRYGTDNLSLFAREVLLAQLQQAAEPPPSSRSCGTGAGRRIELRLSPRLTRRIHEAAAAARMSDSRFIVWLLTQWLEQSPLYTDAEVQALYQSNYQLLAIGRNLNQIARRLNAGQQASLSTQQIQALCDHIREHTRQISQTMLRNRHMLQR